MSSNKANASLTDADVLLTRREAAEYLRRSKPTLERWAALGKGPAFRLIEGRCLYPLIELRRFAGVAAPADRAA